MTPPDVVAFLTAHGLNLVVLDLNPNVDPPVDVPTILDICPALTTFKFNADFWTGGYIQRAQLATLLSDLILRVISLHGLSCAFGIPFGTSVGAIASENWTPLLTQIRRRHADLNMASLNKANFPKLQRIRALSQGMLNTLNKYDGLSGEDNGYGRWSRWPTACLRSGIRHKDCTGQSSGTLPQDDEYKDGSEDESSDERSDGECHDDDDDDSGIRI